MPHPLAICSSCQLVFAVPFITLEAGSAAQIDGISANCPRCNRQASIPDGYYKTVGDTINVLVSSSHSIAKLESLFKKLISDQDRGGDRERIDKTIKEEAPELTGILSLLPRKRSEVYAFLALILAILSYMKQNPSCAPAEAINTVTTVAAPSSLPNRKQRRTQTSKARHK